MLGINRIYILSHYPVNSLEFYCVIRKLLQIQKINVFIHFTYQFFFSLPVEDILENRIVELEKKVFGYGRKGNAHNPMPENNIIESLSSANTLISSALSGREKINAVIQRLPELKSYTESDFEPMDVQVDRKLEYIISMESEIRENAQKLKQLQELVPVLDSDRFKNLPELAEKLDKLTINYVDLGGKTGVIKDESQDLIARYNEILTNISKNLIILDADITELEKKNEPKKVLDQLLCYNSKKIYLYFLL